MCDQNMFIMGKSINLSLRKYANRGTARARFLMFQALRKIGIALEYVQEWIDGFEIA